MTRPPLKLKPLHIGRNSHIKTGGAERVERIDDKAGIDFDDRFNMEIIETTGKHLTDNKAVRDLRKTLCLGAI